MCLTMLHPAGLKFVTPIQASITFGCKGFLEKDSTLFDCWRAAVLSQPGLEFGSLDIGGENHRFQLAFEMC